MRIIWSDLSGVTLKHKLQLQVLKNDNSTEIATSVRFRGVARLRTTAHYLWYSFQLPCKVYLQRNQTTAHMPTPQAPPIWRNKTSHSSIRFKTNAEIIMCHDQANLQSLATCQSVTLLYGPVPQYGDIYLVHTLGVTT